MQTITRTRPRLRRRWDTPFVDAVVACLVSLAVCTPLFRVPATVDRLAFTNPTAYDVQVAVSATGDDRTLDVLSVEHGAEYVVDDVIDQGDSWTFRFRSQGRDAGELTLTRDELAEADWTVAVPAAVEDRLVEAGAHPSP